MFSSDRLSGLLRSKGCVEEDFEIQAIGVVTMTGGFVHGR